MHKRLKKDLLFYIRFIELLCLYLQRIKKLIIMIFIELTWAEKGKKMLVNVEQAQKFMDATNLSTDERRRDAKVSISGISNNGGVWVKETYEEIKQKLIEAGVKII